MAYPKPIPELTAEEAKAFLEDLERFTLTPEQRALYAGPKEKASKEVNLED